MRGRTSEGKDRPESTTPTRYSATLGRCVSVFTTDIYSFFINQSQTQLGWLLIEKRSDILHTLPENLQNLWYDWELQAMVLLSLIFQIILILLGDRRKHIAGNKIGFIIWVAYLSADSVATFALGVLSKSQGQTNTHTDELRALWAPFLLLHLGGPDTITAYALEDNELWLRHLLELLIQASVAFYVIFSSWTRSRLSILTILMFVAGIIKYGERTLALRSASKEHFRNSMLGRPDPGPNYAKFMEGYVSKQDEGYIVKTVRVVEDRLRLKQGLRHHYSWGKNNTLQADQILLKAHELFETFKRLFADLILSFRDGEQSKSFIQQSKPEEAFEVLEIELGFMFDVLYTKAPVVYTSKGGLIRSFCFCLTISVLVVFMTIGKPKHHYSNVDIIITYLLLIVAIILEIYTLIILLFSDWVLLWLSKHKMPSTVNVFLKRLERKKRWSNSMGQYNLISFCLKDEPSHFTKGLLKLCPVQEMLEIYLYTSFKKVTDKLKELIFEQLKGKLAGATTNNNDAKSLCTSGSKEILSGANLQSLLGWSISDVEFHQSILIWHIATDLCYHSDLPPPSSSPELPSACAKAIRDVCRLLSDYMLHLLIAHPIMLPQGIGQIRFRDTCEEARELFKGKKSGFTKRDACAMLLRMNTKIPPIEVKGDRSKSVLFDACRLANSLLSLTKDLKWEIMATVWVDTLSYAASQCRGANHAKQLSQGGELLTHIWLLMAHLGMTEQFQISQGQVRAKLIFG